MEILVPRFLHCYRGLEDGFRESCEVVRDGRQVSFEDL